MNHARADIGCGLCDSPGGDDIDGVGLLGVIGGGLVPGDRCRVQDDVGPDLANEAAHLGGIAQIEGDDALIEGGRRGGARLADEACASLKEDARVGPEEAPGTGHQPRLHETGV